MRRLQPLFLLVLFLLIILPGSAHATSQYIGYTSAQQDGSVCGSNCVNTSNTNWGLGQIIKAPFTGQLASVFVFTGSSVPNRVVIATFGAGTPPTSPQSCSGGGICPFATAGSSFTVQDSEAISVPSQTGSTISLASPVSVTSGQWVAVMFASGSATGAFIMFCGGSATPTCHSIPDAGNTMDGEMNFGSTNPALGATVTTVSNDIGPSLMSGATFQTVGSPVSFITQCYGNCGSPAVTLANTNTTHLTSWNSSITQFYPAQSNLNGFIVNVTVPVARSYTNGNGLVLGLYSVDPSCSVSPFTPSCPGFLQSTQSFTNPAKGTVSMTVRFAVTNGQWFGVAVSGSFNGLDLNDTNTNVHLFQVSSRTPNTISSYTDLGNRLTGLYAWVQGNFVSGTGGSPGQPGCGTVPCYANNLVNALGGGVLGGLAAFGILFGIIGLGTLYFTRQHDSQGHIKGYALPMEFLVIIAVLLLIGLSAIGVLPPYIPLIIIGIVAWMFTSAIWGRNKNTTA